MFGTIIDYLKHYGDCPLQEMPLNDVDSLILCQLAYLKFDGMVSDVREDGPSVTIAELAEHEHFDRLFADERYERDNRALFDGLLKGRRFNGMRLNCYVNMVEKEWQTQFSAITYILEDATVYVAFRGTDESIIGWKEDFNMVFLSPIPGQEYSVKYLNMVMGRIPNPFYVGGHSKGGNLAIYAAMNCREPIRQRILKIYNMDGPGFRPEVMERCGYSLIEDKVVKILPHSSVVGMIFEKGIHYRVIRSKNFGVAQHDPYSWLVHNKEFIETDDIYERRRLMDGTVNEWILTLDEEQLRTFVDTLYQVVSASQADDLITFANDLKKSMNGIAAAWKELDEQTVDMLKETIKSLFEITGEHLKEEIKNTIPKAPKRYKSVRKKVPKVNLRIKKNKQD